MRPCISFQEPPEGNQQRMVDGQGHGSVAQGLVQTLYKEVVYDSSPKSSGG
jgi:hypothetical protein